MTISCSTSSNSGSSEIQICVGVIRGGNKKLGRFFFFFFLFSPYMRQIPNYPSFPLVQEPLPYQPQPNQDDLFLLLRPLDLLPARLLLPHPGGRDLPRPPCRRGEAARHHPAGLCPRQGDHVRPGHQGGGGRGGGGGLRRPGRLCQVRGRKTCEFKNFA